MRRHLITSAATIALAAGLAPSVLAQTADGPSGGSEFNFVHPYMGDINPFMGDISPFRGDINPFMGDINPFRGDINPFYGDISPFWGDISPFWGDINPFFGDINPFMGDISPFWGDISPFMGDINPFWNDISPFWEDAGPRWGDLNSQWSDAQANDGSFDAIADGLAGLLNDANDVFGAAALEQTGQTLDVAVFNALLERFGIELDDPASLADVSAAERSEFFLTLYDQLMSLSGFDHIDHWMPVINWSPALASRYDWGYSPMVGVLDFSVNDVTNMRGQLGERSYLNINHGDAVASLIGAPIDGHGAMGVAPHARMQFYNPFDESLTASWDDVAAGVVALSRGGNRIINMSLGVPGWTLHQEWANVFSDRNVARHAGNLTFVVAAGNDGLEQTVDLDWSGVSVVDNLIIVGSVDPTGNISSFSNTPGDACLTVAGQCHDGYRLMDRFLVAPGELLLVSDGDGGVTRASGTSFAAPLVSGAAALVKGWWYWLDGSEVADVLLESAQDLGAPGTDPVYGRGLLDVAGAMSPLNPDDLYAFSRRRGRVDANDLMITGGRLRLSTVWGGRVFVFEDLGDSFRDFEIPLRDLVVGNTLAQNVADRYAEQYIYERAVSGASNLAFSDQIAQTRLLQEEGNLRITAQARPVDTRDTGVTHSLGFQMSIRMEDLGQGRTLEFGVGESAMALSSSEGFGLNSDHRPESGGVNPVLGFASGGVYGSADYALSEKTRIRFGVTTNYEDPTIVLPGTGEERPLYEGIDPYAAAAVHVGLEHAVSDRLEINASVTQLHEAAALLGTQGSSVLAFEGGADTTAVTAGLDWQMTQRLLLSTSATAAVTHTAGFDGDMLTINEAINSTAAQVSLQLNEVFGSSDRMRFSIVQPLHVEDGALVYTSLHVADRQTGELDSLSQTWDLGSQRAVYAEALYTRQLGSSNAHLSVFARERVSGDLAAAETFSQASAGLSLNLKF